MPGTQHTQPVSPGPGHQGTQRRERGRAAVLFLGLLIFWFALTGRYGLQQLIAGVIAAGLITLFWTPQLRSGPAEADVPVLQLVLRPGFFVYIARMLAEIVKANWAVALIVLNPRLPISPQFVIIRTKLRHGLTRVIYANSITLTPGTISVSLEGDTLIVHALTAEAAEGIGNWPVENRVKELERAWRR